ncbi:MAG TPA: glycosyltransferase family 2 protein [Firmicutes bacterium]|nr:glycosyltransferase family 2 protein [Bacillota bacterium]
MLSFINAFNLSLFILFTVLYSYQIFYAFVALFHKVRPTPPASRNHRYAVLIAARNESSVIAELIDSIQKQKYPKELLDIFVVADNCTDNTADVARRAGAIVYERHNTVQVGKGYALDYILKLIAQDYGEDAYEGFFVFDADNLLDENYVAEMNKLFDRGYRVLTSYRNSKNYDSNWLSAGYSLWFLREAKYLNNPRMILGTSCAISGTGFLVHNDIIKKNHGWKHHLLTEDIEFSIDSVIQGEKIGYCGTAKVYDEQPRTWEQSWNQRLRWSKGFYQVFARYGGRLVKGFVKEHRFGCYDMFMTIAPALFISLASVLVNSVFLLCSVMEWYVIPEMIPTTTMAIATSICNFYLVLYAFGLLTTLTEWKEIDTTPLKKILYTFTFPIFIFTYVPISIVALFRKIEWKPITHSVCKSIEEVARR